MKIMCPHPRSLALSLFAIAFAVLFASASTSSAANATWNGTTSGTWATTTNWSASPVPGSANTATFSGTGNGNTILDLGAGVTLSNLTFDTASAAAYTIGSGAVGSQTLDMFLSGVVQLTATAGNDQTFNAKVSLYSSGLAGGYIYFRNNSTTKTLTLAGGVDGSTGTTKWAHFDGTGDVVVNGGVFNGGNTQMSLEQIGDGNTTLSGVSTYTGSIRIGSGTFTLSGTINGGAAINLMATGGTYQGDGTLVQTSASVLGGSSSINLSAPNGGTNILAGNNSYTGNTTVSQGVLRVTSDNGLGATSGGTTLTGGAQLQLAGDITIGAEALSISGSGPSNTGALRNISGNNTYGGVITPSSNTAGSNRINSDAGTLTLTGNIVGGAHNSPLNMGGPGNITISGNIGNSTSGSRVLFKDGTGIATLSGTNSYTTSTVSGGILTIGQTSAKAGTVTAGAAGTIGLGVGGTGYYTEANVASLFNATLTGFSMNTASGVAIDTTNATGGTFDQSTALTAARSLTKLGAGTLILSSNNTYSGATLVNAGTLIVSGSLTNTSSASVLSGATLKVNGSVNSAAAVFVSGVLSGTGTVGAVTVASGGTLAPGNSPGILNVSSLTGTSGAFLAMEIGKSIGGVDPIAGTDYDQINSSGGVTLGGMTLTLTSVGVAPIELGDKIFLVLNGFGAVGGTFVGLDQDEVFSFNSQDYQISYTADYATSAMTGGNDIALLAVIPEPSTCLLLGLGLMVHVLRRRSRKIAA